MTTDAGQSSCNGTDTFVKVSGYTPSADRLVLLYSRPDYPVTQECVSRCQASRDCLGFVVDYDKSACFRVNSSYEAQNYSLPHIVTIRRYNYFQRTCLRMSAGRQSDHTGVDCSNTEAVPGNCTGRWWALERVPGYELVSSGIALVSNVPDSERCAELCLNENRFPCRSAMFSSPGRCVLSAEDRRTQPDSYRASPGDIEYLENQCIDSNPKGQTCSFQEFPNSSLSYTDVEFTRTTQAQCQSHCESEQYFICRALTFVPGASINESLCQLHGDDTTSAGPSALNTAPGTLYMERVPCLNLLVTCSSSDITVTLRTIEPFRGRMYVQGRSELCNSEGRGASSTQLVIPLEQTTRAGRKINTCGIMVARSLGETNRSLGDINRTLLSAVVIVQSNAIIQRRGDRAVKIGCLLDAASPQNVTLGSSLTFPGTSSLPGIGTVVVNSSSTAPTVQLHIYDRSKGGDTEAQETQLGQSLEFRIDIDPPDSKDYALYLGFVRLKAGHLVATSQDGTESYLLLDEQGCPPDPQTFPAFSKASNTSRSLVANFRAFKFPRSSVVRFNVMVQFCPGTCQPVDCGSGVASYGRRKRDTDPDVSVTETRSPLYQELPMQKTIVVHNPRLASSSLLSPHDNNSNILLLMPEEPGAVCLYYGAIIGMVMAWMLLQFLLLIGCYFLAKYRKKSRRRDETKLEDDFHAYDNHRHVHWADQDS
uniref:ZP domain-containing protein n=1 Tax=Timema tahoe TaxID=61484 RepID=A0A7R9FL05_9NEOP|nr:unnamed protein product [Timema tahoe]